MTSTRQPGSDSVGLDVDALLTEYDVPGCSVAVLDDGEVVLQRGYGTSRITDHAPMAATTRLQACSMSKPVAVLAAMRLVEDGVLDLDADVSDSLTRWRLPVNGDWRPRITLRQLASHTAGLTAHAGFPGYARETVLPSLVDVLSGRYPANAPGARVDLVPGVQFRYSGAGTTLIQLVLEEATGRGAAELFDELVLAPLGLRESTFAQDVDDQDRTHGHLPGSKPVSGGWRVHPELGAAGLWTTAADYLRLLNGVQRAYAGAPRAFLSQPIAHELLEPRATLPSGPDMTGMTHIGLGFFVSTRDGVPTWFGHTGSNVGFVCASMASVRDQRGVVVLTNSDDGASVARLLVRSIAQSRGWSDVVLEGETPTRRPTTLGGRAGAYRTEHGLDVVLAESGGQVELVVAGQTPLMLDFDDPTTLTTEALDLRVLLGTDDSISLDQGGRLTRLRRDHAERRSGS